jgi:flavin reductase (DIM6/NTAB) family NADH-FMN oxidoreductase RutF
MTFTELPVERANQLINHGPTVLVTSKYQEKANIMTAAWCMPASHKPPMVAVSIGLKRFSHELILQGKEFAINVPNSKLLKEMWCCGTRSGRTKDKFALCGLTPVVGKHIEAPLIGECLGAIECRLESNAIAGDHSIMVGEVLAVWAKPGVFEERLRVEKEEAQTLHHLGSKDFCVPGKIVTI